MARILVADDDENIRNLVAFLLQREGHEVITAVDGEDALSRCMPDTPRLLILDLMMPKLSGFEVVRRVRMHSSVPILMLTSRAAESDKVDGLDIGADDYLTKPFSARELLARARALLRRTGTAEVLPAEATSIGGMTIDFKKRKVNVDGRAVQLTPTEFKVLACLAARPGEVLSGRSLVKTLHGYDSTEQEAMDLMRVNINRLRQKVEADPSNPKYVQTVRGFGYTLSPGTGVAAASSRDTVPTGGAMSYELNCKACGQLFRNQDKEQLAREVEEHNRKMHGEERLNREAFEERVRQTV